MLAPGRAGLAAPGLASREISLRPREAFYTNFIPRIKIVWEFLRFCCVLLCVSATDWGVL